MPGSCARCSTVVYFNEEKMAIGKSWHKSCFSCANKQCNRRLDSGNLTEHEGEIYCRSCYGKLFGPKGYGYGVGAGVLSMDTADAYKNGPPTSNIPAVAQAHVAPLQAPVVCKSSQPRWGGADICPRCGKAVYMAEKMMGGGSAWHKTTCFNCKECHKRLESMTLCEREGEIYCKTSLNKTIALQNHLGARTNFNVQRFSQPAIPTNNSFLPDYTSTLSREIPDIIPPVLQQHNQQRLVNLSQLQYPVPEQRTSPLWNNTSQSQCWPMDNSFFNQSVLENRVSNDFSMRMPTRTTELPALRQWQQQLPGNVNLSPFQDHSALSEQNAKLQAMYKSIEAARNSPSFGHRLQYTKKL